jgi:phosphatidylserine/phosphatidylglycerophosphate/cardiolipin synthase-like enzyme
MHNKFAIIDEEAVVAGSLNITKRVLFLSNIIHFLEWIYLSWETEGLIMIPN